MVILYHMGGGDVGVLHQPGLPSDPARAIAGPQARPADVAKIRVQLGLDRPVWVQYRIFITASCTSAAQQGTIPSSACPVGPGPFRFGASYQARKPVIEVLGERIPRTALAGHRSGVGADRDRGRTGVIAAVKRNTSSTTGRSA